jgi:AraC family transcriptional regulator
MSVGISIRENRFGATEMNIFKHLLLDKTVKIERFFHRPGEAHKDPEEELARGFSVNFVEQGNYQISVGKKSWILDEGKVFITRPGMIFRYGHFEELPTDVSLSIDFDERFAEDIFSSEDFDLRQLAPVIGRTNRLRFLEWQISRLVETGGDEMALETVAGELLAVLGKKPDQKRDYKTKQMTWYAERVDAVREIIETEYAGRHSLAQLAQLVGMSPFHFTRIFKELKGRSPYQFLIDVRLERAAEQLLEGVSVTDACFNCGFTNLSHFIRLFRRTFGITPLQIQKRNPEPEKRLKTGK